MLAQLRGEEKKSFRKREIHDDDVRDGNRFLV